MSSYFFPLETLLRRLRQHPEYLPYVFCAAVAAILLVGLLVWLSRKYFGFVFKNLSRNPVRTLLASAATIVLVFVVTLTSSVLLFLDLIMTERSKDLKAIVTERWQIPSQMPFSYAATLEEGAARPEHPEDVKPQDTMTWQFFGATMDPAKRTWENSVFFFALDPRKIRSMMDDLDNLDPALIEKMVNNKKGVLIGRDKLATLNKRVGERFRPTSFNYKGIELEFEIVGQLPEGRYNQNAIMNRDYLNDALDAYAKEHNGAKHPLANKSLNLFWMLVPDSDAFRKLADQVTTSSLYSAPSVKCETASSGMASWLDAYRDLIWGVRWFLIPAVLVTMSLVIANAVSISVRERRTEMAVLKVLGYGPGHILRLVLGEALLVGSGSGLLSAAIAYLLIHEVMGGLPFRIGFFPVIDIPADSMWWGLLAGGITSLAGSILPAWSARTVKVAEVFAKVG